MSGTPPIALTVTTALIASVALVSVAAWISKWIWGALILNPYLVRHRFQVHRLLTAGWIHADASHLIFNMLTLYFFADRVVAVLGPVMFLVLYVSAVVVAHLPTTLRHMGNPKYNSLGASGAVAAVMFSAILLHPSLTLNLFGAIVVPGLVYALGYLAYNAVSAYRARDGINHDAHFAGAIYGSLFAYVLEPTRVTRTLHAFF